MNRYTDLYLFNCVAMLILMNRAFTNRNGLATDIAITAMAMTLKMREVFVEIAPMPVCQVLEFRRAV